MFNRWCEGLLDCYEILSVGTGKLNCPLKKINTYFTGIRIKRDIFTENIWAFSRGTENCPSVNENVPTIVLYFDCSAILWL